VAAPVSFGSVATSPAGKIAVLPFGAAGDQLVVFMQEFNGPQVFVRHIKANGDLGELLSISGTSLASGDVRGRPEAKCNAEGECVATWVQRLSANDTSDANTHVYARRIGRIVNGVPTLVKPDEPVLKLSDDLGGQRLEDIGNLPDIAFGTEGRWVVAWHESDNGQQEKFATRAAVANARPADSAFNFERTTVLAQTAEIRDFNVRVAYRGNDIYLAALSENVGQVPNVPKGVSVALYLLPSGKLAWRDGNGASNYIVGEPGRAATVDLASNRNGEVAVVWSQDFEKAGTRRAIFTSRIQPNGQWTIAEMVDTGAADAGEPTIGKNSSEPAVVIAENGAVTIAWRQRDDKTSGIDSLYFSRRILGDLDIAPRLVESAPGDVADAPAMRLEADGSSVILAWTQRNDDGSDVAPPSAYAARLPAGARQFGAPVLVEGDETLLASNPAVSSSANGKVTVFWRRADGALLLNRSK
jgi:hypothetical protein